MGKNVFVLYCLHVWLYIFPEIKIVCRVIYAILHRNKNGLNKYEKLSISSGEESHCLHTHRRRRWRQQRHNKSHTKYFLWGFFDRHIKVTCFASKIFGLFAQQTRNICMKYEGASSSFSWQNRFAKVYSVINTIKIFLSTVHKIRSLFVQLYVWLFLDFGARFAIIIVLLFSITNIATGRFTSFIFLPNGCISYTKFLHFKWNIRMTVQNISKNDSIHCPPEKNGWKRCW